MSTSTSPSEKRKREQVPSINEPVLAIVVVVVLYFVDCMVVLQVINNTVGSRNRHIQDLEKQRNFTNNIGVEENKKFGKPF